MAVPDRAVQNPFDHNAPLLECRGVSVRYDPNSPFILNDVSFTIPQGSFTYVRGNSGAGKSTLLKLAYMSLPPATGEMNIFNHSHKKLQRNDVAALRRIIGVVFQDYWLLDHLTVMENVALPLQVAGMPPRKIERNVNELLDWVGLSHKAHSLPPTLSGGEKQRVAIARAVINNPRLLIADEPTGNVDSHMATRLFHLFEELNKNGTTIIVATHSDHLAKRFPHRQLLLENGSITEKEVRYAAA